MPTFGTSWPLPQTPPLERPPVPTSFFSLSPFQYGLLLFATLLVGPQVGRQGPFFFSSSSRLVLSLSPTCVRRSRFLPPQTRLAASGTPVAPANFLKVPLLSVQSCSFPQFFYFFRSPKSCGAVHEEANICPIFNLSFGLLLNTPMAVPPLSRRGQIVHEGPPLSFDFFLTPGQVSFPSSSGAFTLPSVETPISTPHLFCRSPLVSFNIRK